MIDLTCDNGRVDVSLTDNERNTINGFISRSQSRVYYVQGSCTTQNETITINQVCSYIQSSLTMHA